MMFFNFPPTGTTLSISTIDNCTYLLIIKKMYSTVSFDPVRLHCWLLQHQRGCDPNYTSPMTSQGRGIHRDISTRSQLHSHHLKYDYLSLFKVNERDGSPPMTSQALANHREISTQSQLYSLHLNICLSLYSKEMKEMAILPNVLCPFLLDMTC